MNDTQEKKRQLNMEERSKLQKLLFTDIDSAATAYKTTRQEERERLKERLITKAPPTVSTLITQYKSAAETISRVEKELTDLGYVYSGYSEKELGISDYNKQPQELVAFDEETARTEANGRAQARLHAPPLCGRRGGARTDLDLSERNYENP